MMDVTDDKKEAVAAATRVDDLAAIDTIWRDHLASAGRLPQMTAAVAAAVDLICEALAAGGLVMTAGNGGSAADAQHLAAELTGRFLRDRAPLRALALHGNPSALTAVANDYGFEQVFAREVLAHGREGDVLVAISTSGNSGNVLRAIEAAHTRGVRVIGLTGESGGQMRDHCHLWVGVPATATPRIQELHTVVIHAVCQLVEARLT